MLIGLAAVLVWLTAGALGELRGRLAADFRLPALWLLVGALLALTDGGLRWLGAYSETGLFGPALLLGAVLAGRPWRFAAGPTWRRTGLPGMLLAGALAGVAGALAPQLSSVGALAGFPPWTFFVAGLLLAVVLWSWRFADEDPAAFHAAQTGCCRPMPLSEPAAVLRLPSLAADQSPAEPSEIGQLTAGPGLDAPRTISACPGAASEEAKKQA